jgi:hypothetical protein
MNFLGLSNIEGVNECFGLGRVLGISLMLIQDFVLICLRYPLGIFGN